MFCSCWQFCVSCCWWVACCMNAFLLYRALLAQRPRLCICLIGDCAGLWDVLNEISSYYCIWSSLIFSWFLHDYNFLKTYTQFKQLTQFIEYHFPPYDNIHCDLDFYLGSVLSDIYCSYHGSLSLFACQSYCPVLF